MYRISKLRTLNDSSQGITKEYCLWLIKNLTGNLNEIELCQHYFLFYVSKLVGLYQNKIKNDKDLKEHRSASVGNQKQDALDNQLYDLINTLNQVGSDEMRSKKL